MLTFDVSVTIGRRPLSYARHWPLQADNNVYNQRVIFGFGEAFHAALKSTEAGSTGIRDMAGGFAKDGAVQDQIDATVEDAVSRARDRLPRGVSLKACAECGQGIPEARRKAVPGVRLCVNCQAHEDAEQGAFSGYNRRGSKDSQLR
jgi:phage/conjugal plasmid C-4 type zinc finger TraR family protein